MAHRLGRRKPPVKKRLVTLAAGAAIVAAAAVPTGSAFAKKAHTPGPVANAARCQLAISLDNELDHEVAAATDPDEKAILQALEANADAKIPTIPGCTLVD
jgi:hypothetical protein